MLDRSLIFIIALIVLMPVQAAEQSAIHIQTIDTGRHYGVVVGDIIQHRYLIITDKHTELTRSSLPETGALNYWLDLIEVDYQQINKSKTREHLVSISYQTFYAPLDVRRLTIPAQQLAFINNDHSHAVTLPAWDFYMSPIKEIAPRAVGASATETAFMQPDITPHTIDTSDRTNIVWLSALLLLSLALLAWNKGFFGVNQSAFQQAGRHIKRLARNENQQTLFQALQEVHLAFNAYAGHALFSHQLNAFLDQHPEFSRFRQAIHDFFRMSHNTLFAEQPENQQNTLVYLQHFCQLLARAERLASKRR